jgi:hypothetical protein
VTNSLRGDSGPCRAEDADGSSTVPEIEWLRASKRDFDFLDFDEADRLVKVADSEWRWMKTPPLKREIFRVPVACFAGCSAAVESSARREPSQNRQVGFAEVRANQIGLLI